MIVPSKCNVKLDGNRSGCHIICFTLLLISMSFLDRMQEFPKVIKHVDAIISPKARVCFNSMSTSFQSECVYCDSKLYTSTMTACTGQPTLANNVTQAQAFCIATACLQVQVLNKAEPMKVAGQLFANYLNKLNLFRPSLLFGGSRNDDGKNWQPTSASSTRTSSQQMRLKSQQKMFGFNGGGSQGYQLSGKKFLMPDPWRPYLRQEVIDIVTDVTAATSDTTTLATTPEPPPKTNGGGEGGATSASATTSGDEVVNLELQVQTSNVAGNGEREKKPIEYPNFNEMHAKIYSNYIDSNQNNRRKFQLWRPFQQNLRPIMSNNRQQLYQLTGSPISNLMQLFSSRLAEKRANWNLQSSSQQQCSDELFLKRGIEDSQTGKVPVVLGRKKRSLVLPSLSFNLNKSKQKLQNNGTVTAQLNKLVNGTTSGNLAFVLNKPSAAYIWSNPLTQLFTKNVPNKSVQWQFGKGQAVPAVPAASLPAAAGLVANPQVAFRPGAAMMVAASGQPQSSQVAAFGRPQALNPNRAAVGGSPVVAANIATTAAQSASPPGSSSLVSQMAAGDLGANGANGAGSFVELADAAAAAAAARG